MSQHVSTPANAADHDPVLGSATEFSLSGGSGCTCGNEEIRKSLQKELESMHKARVDMLDEHIKDLEMVKLAKEFAINAVKERLEQEMAEKDATNQRSLVRCIYHFQLSLSNDQQDCVRQFWHEARLGRSVEADRAWKLDANLTKKTTECEDLATTNANLKRVLASVEVRG